MSRLQIGGARVRLVVGAAVVLVLATGWFLAPTLLRRVAFFHVRQIELVGVRYLSPGAVITALRLRPDVSVFDETAPLAARVRELRGVAEARVERRLPAALQVIVREVEPVAFVAAPAGGRGLIAVDAAGQALPYDPARVTLDLPVAATADSGVTGVLALVRSVDPTLFQDVTAARRVGRGDVELEVGPVAHRVLLTRDAGPEVVRAVLLVTQDLATRGRSYAELDARYAGQVVVRGIPHPRPPRPRASTHTPARKPKARERGKRV